MHRKSGRNHKRDSQLEVTILTIDAFDWSLRQAFAIAFLDPSLGFYNQ